jgi:hypothetical protein
LEPSSARLALPALERQFGIQPGFDKEEWDRVHYQVRALNEIAANSTELALITRALPLLTLRTSLSTSSSTPDGS